MDGEAEIHIKPAFLARHPGLQAPDPWSSVSAVQEVDPASLHPVSAAHPPLPGLPDFLYLLFLFVIALCVF